MYAKKASPPGSSPPHEPDLSHLATRKVDTVTSLAAEMMLRHADEEAALSAQNQGDPGPTPPVVEHVPELPMPMQTISPFPPAAWSATPPPASSSAPPASSSPSFHAVPPPAWSTVRPTAPREAADAPARGARGARGARVAMLVLVGLILATASAAAAFVLTR